MVLELIVIGGAVYYYVRKNKQEKAKKAAFAAGQPWTNRDGTVTYPANYPGLPGLPAYSAGDYKRQTPDNVQNDYYYQDTPQHVTSHSPPPPAPESGMALTRAAPLPLNDEKAPLAVETREVFKDEKR